MKYVEKKNKLLSAILMLSGSASFAGTMGAVCQEGHLTLPCDMKKWSVGGQALYMQMTTGNIVADSTLRGSTGQAIQRGVNPSWSWGFQLEGAYQFQNGKDINLNWYHLRGSSSLPVTGAQNAGSVFLPVDPVGNGVPTGLGSITYNSISSVQNNAWDMVNIEHGRQINFDDDFHARIHFGGEFSRVMQNALINTNITQIFTSPPNINAIYNNNTTAVYNGFGPRLGLDLVYTTPYHIGFYGKGAVGILAGTAKTQYIGTSTTRTTSGSITTTTTPSSLYINDNRVVTSIDAKLGLNYMYALAQGDITLDAGWMWVNYLNALASRDLVSGVQSNAFSVQGLYFGAKWTGDFV